MKLIYDPGTEPWVLFAKKRMADLTRLRRQVGLVKMVKPFAPASGVLIWLCSSDFGDWIRITGGAAGVRYFGFSGFSLHKSPDLLVIAAGTAQHSSSWSKDLSTRVEQGEPNSPPHTFVVTRQETGETITLTNCGPGKPGKLRTDRPTFTGYVQDAAWISADGTYVTVSPYDDITTVPEQYLYARVAKWTPATESTPGSWSTFDVGLPPEFEAAIGGVDRTLITGYGSRGVLPALEPGVNAVYVSPQTRIASVTAHVDPYKRDALYLDCRGFRVPSYTMSAGIGSNYYEADMEPVQGVWKYDYATATWSRVYTHPTPFTMLLGQVLPNIYHGTMNGVQTHTSPMFTAYMPVFTPQGGYHTLTFDDRATPLPEANTTPFSSGPNVFNATDRPAPDYSVAPVVRIDGVTVLTRTFSSGYFDFFVNGAASTSPYYAWYELDVQQVALVDGAFRIALGPAPSPQPAAAQPDSCWGQWKWGTGEMLFTKAQQQAGNAPSVFSLSLETGAGGRYLHRAGKTYDGMSGSTVTEFGALRASIDSEGVLLSRVVRHDATLGDVTTVELGTIEVPDGQTELAYTKGTVFPHKVMVQYPADALSPMEFTYDAGDIVPDECVV